MDWFVIIAGLFAVATTVGHFAVGSKAFLKPMLNATFDPIPKKVMHCVFHYVSTYLILSTIMLLLIVFNIWPGNGSTPVIIFIAANYIMFAIWQIALAHASDIPRGIFKLFQWIFFVLITLFSFLGIIL